MNNGDFSNNTNDHSLLFKLILIIVSIILIFSLLFLWKSSSKPKEEVVLEGITEIKSEPIEPTPTPEAGEAAEEEEESKETPVTESVPIEREIQTEPTSKISMGTKLPEVEKVSKKKVIETKGIKSRYEDPIRNLASEEPKKDNIFKYQAGLFWQSTTLIKTAESIRLEQNAPSFYGKATYSLYPKKLEFSFDLFVNLLAFPKVTQNASKSLFYKANLYGEYGAPMDEEKEVYLKVGLGWYYWSVFAVENSNLGLKALQVYAPTGFVGVQDYGLSKRRQKSLYLKMSLIPQGGLKARNIEFSFQGKYQLNAPDSNTPIYGLLDYTYFNFFETNTAQFQIKNFGIGILFGF